ncbi:hypothetical protein WJX84_000351 [Apatococcus fuscideae]|uniref:Helicase ATP-binding domain-containing protein n=1 Tax=Apatococcus fuscideae TaxID=2026836 RepID=A0AAW1TES8_9CHLO
MAVPPPSILPSSSRQVFPAFPYAPYPVQHDFMQSVYTCLQNGGIGLFESPTGTGKTLSLLCSVLHWLQDANDATCAEESTASRPALDMSEPDWLRAPSGENLYGAKAAEATSAVPRVCLKGQKAPGRSSQASSATLNRREAVLHGGDDSEEAEFLLDDAMDSETDPGHARGHPADSDTSSSGSTSSHSPGVLPKKRAQVFFCSRTHSQLSQVIQEIGRTPFKDSLSFVPLGSRKALCVNASVQKLGSAARMNERCLELQKPVAKKRRSSGDPKQASKGSAGCPYLKASAKRQQRLQAQILEQVMDVEDLAIQGQQHRSCPYYATRHALPAADVILMPYSFLLTQASRDAVGINLHNAIVVVDEAHNLVDAVGSAHSASVTRVQLQTSQSQLAAYLAYFRQRLSASELHLHSPFLGSKGLDNINMFRLVRFMKESKLLYKVSGHCEHRLAKAAASPFPRGPEGQADQADGPGTSKTSRAPDLAAGDGSSGLSALHAAVAFIGALTDDAADGRVLINPQQESLKFLLLNPAAHFSQVVEQAHAVVLASGTLAPAVPQGVVAFASSFAYIAQLHQHWQGSGAWARLSAKKAAFVEPHTAAGVAACLQEFSCAALASPAPGPGKSGPSGALLLCVVGGRLSEGINFGDGLGRAVVMLGLPFPNPADAELQEHIRYLNVLPAEPAVASSETSQREGVGHAVGQRYYEDLCMKAVNQCIGRVIRHQKDWAAILLADVRWSSTSSSSGKQQRTLLQQLPAWMLPSLVDTKPSFGPAYAQLHAFLRLTVAVKDADLEQLRETREWLDALDTMQGGLSSRSVAGLRAEAKAPFRLARILTFGGLFAGASIGLVIISTRLFTAFVGSDGAPDTLETAKNFGINLAAAALLGFLLRRDLASQSKDRRTVEREEAFARLQVNVGDRVLPVAAFRGTTRPVLIVGTKGHIQRAIRAAEPFKYELRQRGVSLITLQTDELDSNSKLDALKKEFGRSKPSKGFGQQAPAAGKEEVPKAKASKGETDRWQLEVAGKEEWLQWLAQQRREAAAEGDTVYVQVQLDGTVRSSGGGAPPWQRLVNDLPEVNSLQTRLTDGLGRV